VSPRLAGRWIGDDYAWKADGSDMEQECASPGQILIGNVGSLANSHPGIHNTVLESEYNPILDRRIDPGAGASTDYMVSFKSEGVIDAATEIFLDYGKHDSMAH
jgi:hypothetical protein